MDTITISRFNSAKDNAPKRCETSIDDLARELSEPCTLDTDATVYFASDGGYRKRVKQGLAAWSPAAFSEGVARSADAVESVGCVVLDLDDEHDGIAEIADRMRLHSWRGALHTTISDRGGVDGSARCFRLVVFTDRDLTPDEYPTVREEAGRQLRVTVDPATKDAARIYFVPAQLRGGTFEARDLPGELAKVNELLAQAQVRHSPESDTARGAKGGRKVRKGGGRGEGTGEGGALPTGERGAFAQALDFLASVTPEGAPCTRGGFALPYAEWRNVGFAVRHAYGNTKEGVEVFASWSANAENFDGPGVAKLWKDAVTDGGITYPWVFKQAQALGWTNPGTISGEGGQSEGERWREAAARLSGGTQGLVPTSRGKIASNIHNAIQVLLRDSRTKGAVAFNSFAQSVEVLRPLREVFGPSASAGIGDFREHDLTPIRAWLVGEYRIDISKADAFDAVMDWARHCEFNPVADALNRHAEAWDKVHRLDTWLTVYMGAGIDGGSEYLREVGRRWIVSAVARALCPGCKADHVLVIEGAQGVGKSSALRALAEAVYPTGFIDALPILGERQEAARALRGAFIVELAELTTFRKAEAEHVKAFLTTQADRVRDPYSRAYENRPRTCVFAGSTNESEWSPDVSGGRRFWPVQVGHVDLGALKRDAAMLWGEAVHAYRNGEPWHLTDRVAIARAGEVQRDRLITDAWDEAVQDFIAQQKSGSHAWSLADLAAEILSISGREFSMPDQKRLAASLTRSGFIQKKTGGRMRWRLPAEVTLGSLRAADTGPALTPTPTRTLRAVV